MNRTCAPFLVASCLLAACNPATGDGTPASNDSNGATNGTAGPPNEAMAPSPEADPRDDALVPGTQFHAMGLVRCVTPSRRSARDCTAGVIRDRDGGATVTIFSPEGRSRAIFFDPGGTAIGADTAEADGSASQPFAARRSGDTTIVTLGPERYEIARALVTGR